MFARGAPKMKEFSSLEEWIKYFKTNDYFTEWSDFVLHDVLSPDGTELSEIYKAIKRKYPEICVDYITYWGSPKWKHMVRSVLDGLMKKGLAQSVRRGMWIRLI